jgi:hypothetical protein
VEVDLIVRLGLFMVVIILGVPCATGQPNVVARLPETTRAEVVERAKALASHIWIAGDANLKASCSKRYVSDWKVGQRITGLPYCWGGVDTVEIFDSKLGKGLAAGAHSRYGVLSCAAGIDCSGFVTRAWGLQLAGHTYSTSNLRLIAGKPRYNWFTDMKPGDALNKAGSHVVLFTGYNPDGSINVCEASGSAARVICHRTTWSRYTGYIPLVYKGIED